MKEKTKKKEAEKKQKGFGSYFFKCLLIFWLIAFLFYGVSTVISLVITLKNDMDATSLASSELSNLFQRGILPIIQFAIPSYLIIFSIPVSIAYGMAKRPK